MSVDLEGGIELAIQLQRMGDDYVRQTMAGLRKEAIAVRDLARRMAPLEMGALETAIKVDTTEQTRDASGRFGVRDIVIYVDPAEPAPDRPAGTLVGQYATYMHEGSYQLGPLSLAKQAAEGVEVGPHFMERAADEVSKTLEERLVEANFNLLG